MGDEPRTVEAASEYRDEVERLIQAIWLAMQAVQAEGDNETSQRLSPIHHRLVRIQIQHD